MEVFDNLSFRSNEVSLFPLSDQVFLQQTLQNPFARSRFEVLLNLFDLAFDVLPIRVSERLRRKRFQFCFPLVGRTGGVWRMIADPAEMSI